MRKLGHYKIIGSTQKDYKNYPILAEVTKDEFGEQKIKIEIMENKAHNFPVGDFAMKWTGVKGFGSTYWHSTKTNFIGWLVTADKIDKFFGAFSGTIKSKYKSFRLFIDEDILKELKILAKL
jgi:hypothetical protein